MLQVNKQTQSHQWPPMLKNYLFEIKFFAADKKNVESKLQHLGLSVLLKTLPYLRLKPTTIELVSRAAYLTRPLGQININFLSRFSSKFSWLQWFSPHLTSPLTLLQTCRISRQFIFPMNAQEMFCRSKQTFTNTNRIFYDFLMKHTWLFTWVA